MNWKQHKLLSISTVLFILFMLVGGGLLFKTRSEYLKQKQELRVKLGELDKLNKRKPFPNQDNLKVMKDSLERVESFYETMMSTMSREQVKPKRIEPAQFPALLNASLHRLRQLAKKENIALPPGFSFGFQAYADGSLPKSDHVARLTSQMQMIESLVTTFVEAGAESLLNVERETFEKEELITEMRRSRSLRSAKKEPEPVEESELYNSETITLSFIGKDESVWSVLNALAAHDQFIVVTQVEVENPVKPNVAAIPVFRKADGGIPGQKSGSPVDDAMLMFMDSDMDIDFPSAVSLEFPSGVPGGGATGVSGSLGDASTAEAEEAALGSPLSHERRIVAGREPVKASITVKVFQFQTDEPSDESKEAQKGSSS